MLDTLPNAGKRTGFACFPSASNNFISEAAFLVYSAAIFPPTGTMYSRLASVSGITTCQYSRCGAARLIENTRHSGAFQLVCKYSRSPAREGKNVDGRSFTTVTTGPGSFKSCK